MIDVYYYTVTGNIPRFLAGCGIIGRSINEATRPTSPFVLVTNTLGFGEVPAPVAEFLVANSSLMVGVAGSGNRNWGTNFAKAARIISAQYGVPLVYTFELAGTADDIKYFTERMRSFD